MSAALSCFGGPLEPGLQGPLLTAASTVRYRYLSESEEGVDALSSMLDAGGLVSLRQVSLPPQLCAIPQLTTACGARGILLQP